MPAAQRLRNLGYARDSSGVWSRDGGDGLAYADGAEDILERHFAGDAEAVRNAPAALRWPLLYHLSPERTAIVDPLRLQGRVLEIGAGMGAVTAGLLATAAEVVAVEGAVARARVLRRRFAAEARLEVVRGDILGLTFDGEFDAVTSIGVLEYAGEFAPAGPEGPEAAARGFLAACARYLRPGGRLVVAIENRFGAKYLTGCHEDHYGAPFIGVEGYDGAGKGIRTWARDELARLVEGAGFTVARVYGCWPDYKFPSWIVDVAAPRGAVARLAAEWGPTPVRDHQPTRLFRERAFVTAAAGSDLFAQIWNSYLLVAVKR